MSDVKREYIGVRPGLRAVRAPVLPDTRTEKPQRKARRRRTPWTLARLVRRFRSAPAVWLALLDLADARGSKIVTPTRPELAEATGIARMKTISAALTALECAGWIERVHVPVRDGGQVTALLLRIVLRRMGQQTPHTKRHAVRGEKRPKGKGRKTPHDFPTERGAPTAPAPLGLSAGAGAAAPAPLPEQPTTRIEPELSAAIQSEPEAAERQNHEPQAPR